MTEVTMLKKLGAKQVLGNIKAITNTMCEKDGDTCKAYTIFGQSNGVKTGVGTYGTWYAFQGQMEAINHVSGERFAAIQCFIPEPIQSMLLDALKDHEQIEFAFTVSVKRRDDLKEGYEYLVTPHKETRESDPLANLRGLIPDYSKQKTPEKIEPVQADIEDAPKDTPAPKDDPKAGKKK